MNAKLNFKNVRSEEQEKRMQKAATEKLCPFCGEGLNVIHKNPILKRTKNFMFTASAFPYEGTKHHFLIIPKKHIVNLQKITGSMWSEVGNLFKYAQKTNKIKGGGMFLRFGEMHTNGSSIDHIHFHIISGEASEKDPKEKREAIKVKLGYKKIK